MPTATKRFHFDLFHLGDDAPELTFHVGQNKYAVEPHTTETLAAAVQDNKALALIPPSHHHKITHFVDVSHEHLPTDRLCRLKVTYDHGDPNLHLPALVHASFHIPEEYRAALSKVHSVCGSENDVCATVRPLLLFADLRY